MRRSARGRISRPNPSTNLAGVEREQSDEETVHDGLNRRVDTCDNPISSPSRHHGCKSTQDPNTHLRNFQSRRANVEGWQPRQLRGNRIRYQPLRHQRESPRITHGHRYDPKGNVVHRNAIRLGRHDTTRIRLLWIRTICVPKDRDSRPTHGGYPICQGEEIQRTTTSWRPRLLPDVRARCFPRGHLPGSRQVRSSRRTWRTRRTPQRPVLEAQIYRNASYTCTHVNNEISTTESAFQNERGVVGVSFRARSAY